MSLLAAALVVLIGVLIGTVGLGGFLMVPVLVYLQGASVREAVVVAAMAFLASGLVSLGLWGRQRTFALRPFRGFLIATAPGAILGALVVHAVADRALAVVIAVAFAAAGIAEWYGWPRATPERAPGAGATAGGGLATGFGSALTGTSGPMVAMPLLAWLGLPLRQRILLAQIAQVPIALGSTLAFLSLAAIPWRLGALASAALCAGVVAGSLSASRVGTHWLRRFAALLMLGAAVSMGAKIHG